MRLVRNLSLFVAALAVSAANAATLMPEQLQADLQLARRALEEAHGGIYRYTPKADIDRTFDEAAAKLDQPMDELAFLRILAPAVAALRCGHTSVQLSPELKAQRAQALLLPFDVRVLSGRLYILRDYARAGALAGREIVSINGVASAVIIARLAAVVAGDGFIATSRERDVSHSIKEGLYAHFGMQGQFVLELRSAHGGTDVEKIDGQALAALKSESARRYPQDQFSNKFTALSMLDDGRIAHLQVFNFSDAGEDDAGAVILKKAFETMAASGTQTLILDLRDNGGGKDALGKQLYSHLVESPFKYYEDLMVKRPGLSFAQHVEGRAGVPASALQLRADGLYAPRRHPNLGIQQPALPAFKGKVIALINGWSFSTTAELITQLHDKKRATFVGEEAGGAYHGNTSGGNAELVLPNSGLRVMIPLMSYTLAVSGKYPNGRGTVPEEVLVPSINDLVVGRDTQLEKALSMARSSASNP